MEHDYLIHMSDDIAHTGVLGMRWRYHKNKEAAKVYADTKQLELNAEANKARVEASVAKQRAENLTKESQELSDKGNYSKSAKVAKEATKAAKDYEKKSDKAAKASEKASKWMTSMDEIFSEVSVRELSSVTSANTKYPESKISKATQKNTKYR